MITFDEHGYLIKHYDLNISQFKELFVDKWSRETSTRYAIFEIFEKYLTDFQTTITPDFDMWIDGSFVTQKSNPQDIDFVSFIDHTIYDEKEQLLDNQFRKYGAKNFYGQLIDAYICVVHPSNHEKAIITQSDERYWLNQFSYTKPNRQNKKYSKGFIKMKFNGISNGNG